MTASGGAAAAAEGAPRPSGTAAAGSDRSNIRALRLDFECINSLPGGFSEVRVWHDNLLNCERVGKRIDISALATRDALPEPATLQSIKDDNIVPVLAAARVEDPRFAMVGPVEVVEFITPYYERGSVSDALLRGETFTASQAVSIVQAILRGLSALHEKYGIAHRDMKSGNVLLTQDRHLALVADLGLAGRFDDRGHVPGLENPTLYSPRELVATGELTRASDLYPVGLTLRELLGGPFPYDSITMTDIVEALMRLHSPVPREERDLPIWVSRSMRRVYNKATAVDPRQRYQSAREMDEALSGVVAVDWQRVGSDRWEAPFVRSPRRIAVETRVMRGGKTRMSTLVKGKAWRRAREDVDLADLTSAQARAVFDQANDIANAR